MIEGRAKTPWHSQGRIPKHACLVKNLIALTREEGLHFATACFARRTEISAHEMGGDALPAEIHSG